jgi:DNA modification methylase
MKKSAKMKGNPPTTGGKLVIDNIRAKEKKKNVKGLLGNSFPTIRPYDEYNPDDNTVSVMGTSIFDPVLCEALYTWFTRPGAQILDPFAGGSVRGIVASYLGRHYTGIDLSAEQIAANIQQGKKICTPDLMPQWIVGDSRDVQSLAPGAYDFILTCPPYTDLEIYSDDPKDISTLGYDDFIIVLGDIIKNSVTMLNDNRFAAIVVGDIRDKDGFYHNFPADTIEAFQAAGMRLYNEAILVTVAGSLPIRVGKSFTASRKMGKTHQNVLIFVKGNPKEATKWCGKVEVCGIMEKEDK